MPFNELPIDLDNSYHLLERHPLTVSPDSYVIDAVSLMNQHRTKSLLLKTFQSSWIGGNWNFPESSCVLVVDAGKLLGIFTERDLVRLSASKIDLSAVKITDVMTKPVITMKIGHFQDISSVLSLLHQYHICHLPILDDQENLLGIITANSLLQELNQLQLSTCHQTLQKESECSLYLQEKKLLNHQQIGKISELFPQEINQCRQAQILLQESEEILNLALEAAEMGVWDWQMATKQTTWSANMGRLYGLPNNTLCPCLEEFLHLIHPQDQEVFVQAFKRCIEQKQPFAVDYRTVWPDGSIHWLNSRGKAYYNEDGEVIRLIGITRDISDVYDELRLRKQAEIALRDSEELYRSVVAAMSEGIILQGADGRIIACNSSAEQILGLNRQEILERKSDDRRWQTIYEDGSPFPSEKYPAIVTLRTGQPCSNIIMGVYRPDGELRWISISSQPLCRENETVPYGVVTSFADVSERQQAQQKIREQAALLDVATDAIFVRDLQTQILFWNQGAERVYGWSTEEAIGRNAQDLLCPQNLADLDQQPLKVVLEMGIWQGELRKLTKSGQEIIVESRWTLMRDAAGKPKSILVVDTDITQKKLLEEQFFRAQRLESLGTLAGGIAHDLNNILTPILAAGQLLKGKLNQDKKRAVTLGGTPSPSVKVGFGSSLHLLEIIESNAKRGASLVKQVLSFARGFKGERTAVQLKHLINDIILIGKQTFPKSIEFMTSFSEELWAVSGDVTQLHQVLMNLVVNARDAMPDGGSINITAENIFIDEAYTRMNLQAKVGHYLQLTVSDTGTGMPPEVLNRIFEPFFTTKDVTTGTGLGLSTAMGIIKSHGGFINVSSQVGQGSKFVVFLPAIATQTDLKINKEETHLGNGELILIVDDEAPICEISKIILETHNYKTLTACNGIEAIALYAQHKYHISAVIMDVMMPEMDGITAIRTLQKMNPQIKIIASTGLNSSDTLAQTDITGLQEILSKPFTAQDLLSSVYHVLGDGA